MAPLPLQSSGRQNPPLQAASASSPASTTFSQDWPSARSGWQVPAAEQKAWGWQSSWLEQVSTQAPWRQRPTDKLDRLDLNPVGRNTR